MQLAAAGQPKLRTTVVQIILQRPTEDQFHVVVLCSYWMANFQRKLVTKSTESYFNQWHRFCCILLLLHRLRTEVGSFLCRGFTIKIKLVTWQYLRFILAEYHFAPITLLLLWFYELIWLSYLFIQADQMPSVFLCVCMSGTNRNRCTQRLLTLRANPDRTWKIGQSDLLYGSQSPGCK